MRKANGFIRTIDGNYINISSISILTLCKGTGTSYYIVANERLDLEGTPETLGIFNSKKEAQAALDDMMDGE
jgi:hypothetical protein